MYYLQIIYYRKFVISSHFHILLNKYVKNCLYVVFQNTFWFGLGGCCILLIPSIIFSVKLSKYYRRMDTEDVFEE